MNSYKLQLTDTFELQGTVKMFDFDKCMSFLFQSGKTIYGNHFSINKQQKQVLSKLLIYAIEEPKKMAQYELDLRKGILLMGESGTGKTAMMRLIKPFLMRKKQYDIRTCRELSQEFSIKGFEMTVPILSPNSKPLVLDNMGKEAISKHYGYTCDVIPNIIEHFYEQRHDTTYAKIHITTTLSPKEIEKRYGIEFRKMLQQLFNVIICE